MTDFERATGCPHCEPYHSNPWTKAWAVQVSSCRDSDGQPTVLYAGPTDCSHVAESDAEWLRQVIRDAKEAYGRQKSADTTLPADWDAQPQRIGGCQCIQLETENLRLWKRAAESNYAATRADLRAAQLRLVLGSVLRTFGKQRRPRSDAWRTSQVETATLHRWWQVFEANRPRTSSEAPEGGDRHRELREQLVTAGTEAADQWLAARANRRMSEVNRKRLAGYVVGTLWEQIEQAAIEIAEALAESDRRSKVDIEWGVRYDDGNLSDAVVDDFDGALQQVGRNLHRGSHIVTRTVGGWTPVICCVCSSGAVVYCNYKGQLFCKPCADGDGPRAMQGAVNE